jgi:predicted ArsR family transcriptional regulator
MAKDDLSKKILTFLEKQEWPSTTEDIATAIGATWHTAQIHLFKLQAEGKIKYRKVGRQNQWWLIEKYRKEFRG